MSYKCDFCDDSFSDPSDLDAHVCKRWSDQDCLPDMSESFYGLEWLVYDGHLFLPSLVNDDWEYSDVPAADVFGHGIYDRWHIYYKELPTPPLTHLEAFLFPVEICL